MNHSYAHRRQIFRAGFWLRLVAASCVLLTVTWAKPLGLADVTELPKANGAGDIPDIMIELVPMKMGPAASRSKHLMLSSLRGRVTLLDLFWSRCPHCEEHAPHIAELYNQYRQRGVNVLGLATDRSDNPDDVASVKSFITKTKVNYPIGFITSEVINLYADPKDRGVPQMVLFGADGKLVKRIIGWDEARGKELRQAIDAQLAKAPASKSTNQAKPASPKAKKS